MTYGTKYNKHYYQQNILYNSNLKYTNTFCYSRVPHADGLPNGVSAEIGFFIVLLLIKYPVEPQKGDHTGHGGHQSNIFTLIIKIIIFSLVHTNNKR